MPVMIEFQYREIKLPDGSGVIICRIKGSIDGSTVYTFEEKLSGFLDQGVHNLILVFSQVQYINSTGMGVLVKLADKSRSQQGDFCLVEVQDRIVSLFNVLGLMKFIKLFKTEEEAIRHFQPKAKQKVFAITCKKCARKVSLGTNLIEGVYQCPVCMSKFRLLGNGKVQYLSATE